MENVPAEQSEQLVDCAAEASAYFPAAQVEHAVAPEEAAYFPSGQAVQATENDVVALWAKTLPAEHAAHAPAAPIFKIAFIHHGVA
jgi:hypothetical protein